MANKRANPLSGYFKSPPTAEKSKEAAKAEMEAEAGILGSTGEEQKPPEQTKDGKEQKAPAADGPAKPGEEQKPPEPTKDGKEQKVPTDGPTKPGEEQKPPEPTKDGKEQKASADGPAKPGEEQKPPEPEKDPKLRFVKLSDIKPLSGTYVKDTPRSDYSDLIASIKEHGLEQPIILRQGEKGDYQLVHGFHRCEALKQAGMLEIRADVYAMKLSEASDYRRNRDKNPPIPGTLILPFPTQQPEKAVDGEKGEKPPLAAEAPSAPGTGEPEANRTAEGPKGSTVTHMVDNKKLSLDTAEQISHLKPEEQKQLADAIEKEGGKVPSKSEAVKLKEDSKAGNLTPEKIEKAVAPTKREMTVELKVSFTDAELRPYFPAKTTTPGEAKKAMFEGLALRQKALERQKAQAAEKQSAGQDGRPKKPPSPTAGKQKPEKDGKPKKPPAPTR